MVVDAVLYNGERDIFDLRYGILKDVVDEFVVVEFGKTFSGKVKEAHPINLPKVSYHFFTQVDFRKQMEFPPAFEMEFNQREMIHQCLTHLKDEDIVFVGDVDEIWEPDKIETGTKSRLRVYAYWLNHRSSEDFALGPVCMEYKILKHWGLNRLRTDTPLTADLRGWHFTNMGGPEALRKKIEAYGHQEFNTLEIKENLVERMMRSQDYIGRDFKMRKDESELPSYLLQNKEQFKHLLL